MTDVYGISISKKQELSSFVEEIKNFDGDIIIIFDIEVSKHTKKVKRGKKYD